MVNQDVYEVEISLLNLLISDEKVLLEKIGYITKECFFDEQNKYIFTTIETLFNQNKQIDITLIVNEIKKQNDKVISMDRFIDIKEAIGIRSNVDSYIKILEERFKKYKIKDKIEEMSKFVNNDGIKLSAEDLIDSISSEILDITSYSTKKEFEDIKDLAPEFLINYAKDLKNKKQGLKTGHPSLDKITTGFHDSDLIIIGARPSMGKTAFALDIAYKIAKMKKGKVLFFSLEMTSHQLVRRLFTSIGLVSSEKLRENKNLTTQEYTRLVEAGEEVKKLNLKMDDSGYLSIQDLEWKCRKEARKQPLSCIILDYLQLMHCKTNNNSNKNEEVSIITRKLKALAKELNLPIIVLAQLNRQVEMREDKRPLMSDLRDSGSIEQDADLVIFLYRDAYYNEVEKIKEGQNIEEIEVRIAKHRNGRTGTARLYMQMDYGKFTDPTNMKEGK